MRAELKKTKIEKHKKIGVNAVQLLIMAGSGALFLFVFSYLPMFGIILAFKDGDNALNIMNVILSPKWADMNGFRNFHELFTDSRLGDVITNTVVFNILNLVISMPATVILALLFNEVKHPRLTKGIQLLTYLPHFVSAVVYVGIIHSLVDMDTGIVNMLLIKLGIIEKSVNFKGNPNYSWGLMIISGILKGTGWGSIIYMAAITNVDVELYDATDIDGANRFQRAWYITVPTLMPLFSLNLVLNISNILSNDAGTMLLWQTQSNLEKTEVFSTFILKNGINEMRYSYATAAGLIKSLIGIVLILVTNWITKKINGEGAIF